MASFGSRGSERLELIERNNKDITVKRQCELLSVPRSAVYSKQPDPATTDLELMRLIDQQYLKTPFYGTRRMTAHLRRLGHLVNRKRVRRLMRKMGLVAIYPRPKTSEAAPEHKKYPYAAQGIGRAQ